MKIKTNLQGTFYRPSGQRHEEKTAGRFLPILQ